MSEPYDVLVVCEGNLCRSPLAERLLTSRLAGGEVRVASAGVHAVVGAPMDASAAAELTRLGLAARLWDLRWGDHEGDVAETLARAAEWRASVSGLGNALAVPVLIGRSPEVHRAAADLADRATRVIAAWLG